METAVISWTLRDHFRGRPRWTSSVCSNAGHSRVLYDFLDPEGLHRTILFCYSGVPQMLAKPTATEHAKLCLTLSTTVH